MSARPLASPADATVANLDRDIVALNKNSHSILAFVPKFRQDDLRHATDAYAIEIAMGRTPYVALNYATAVYVECHPQIQAGDARDLVRAAIIDDI